MRTKIIACTFLFLAFGPLAFAALLGVNPGVPTFSFDRPVVGALSYDAGSRQLTLSSAGDPLYVQFTSGAFPTIVAAAAGDASSHMSISVTVDHSGNLVGSSSRDIVVRGTVTDPNNAAITYTGDLLTGSVTGFGYTQLTASTSMFDFRFTVTGGSLASYPGILGKDLGVVITNENSTFTGSFATSFSGQLKGTIGPIAAACCAPVANMTITKSHIGNFIQGQVGAIYTLLVANTGAAASSGTTTVVDTLPAGLTATAIAGVGWNCTLATLSCTRSDALAAGASFGLITVTVNVAANAAGTLTNTAAIPGCCTATDTTTITPGPTPALNITKTHVGNFSQGQTGATYSLTVTNTGGAVNTGAITVTDMLPVGLAATAIAGSGWTCTLATLTCARADSLAAGASFPVITVTVNVAANAPATLTNMAAVSGCCTATDTTTIIPGPGPVIILPAVVLTITKSHVGNFTQGQTGATYSIIVTNVGPVPTSAPVVVTDTLPPGLTATAISGNGWTCTLATLSCTRSDVLNAMPIALSYPPITVTVNVASNASGTLTNLAAIAGCCTTSDTTIIVPVTQLPVLITTPDVTIHKMHAGNFAQGDAADTYTLIVTNVGTGPTAGTVTVVDTMPAGLTATAISGTGWTCVLGTLTCTRNDAVAAGASYPAITVTVSVANSGTAFGGGAGSASFQSGDVFLSMADGTVQWRRADWTLVKTIANNTDGQAKGMAFDTAGNLFVTHWTGKTGNDVVKFDRNGNLIGLFGSGYGCNPSSILFDNVGNVYVGQADCGAAVLKFDASGNPLATYNIAVENRGSSHIILDANQCTLYYTSEGPNVKRFNVCTNSQMADFNTAALPDPTGGAQEFALLPTGGMLVADFAVIARLDAAGNLVRTYNAPSASHCWLGMALDADGTSFWASNWCESSVTRFDMASGNVLESHVADPNGFMLKQIATPGNIFPASVTNVATVSGGGEVNLTNNVANDITIINTATPHVVTPVYVSDGAVVNAASYTPVVAAGSIASVFGTNLASGVATATALPLPMTLASGAFQIGTNGAPMFYASPTQANVQIPWEVSGQASVMITGKPGASPQVVNVAEFAPGIFTANSSGSSQGVVMMANTTKMAAVGSAAPRGTYVTIFCTGLGAVTNRPATGVAAKADPLSLSITTPSVTIGGVPATVTFSGLAPGLVGLYQVNARVPDGIAPGNAVPVVISIGNAKSNAATIAVQ